MIVFVYYSTLQTSAFKRQLSMYVNGNMQRDKWNRDQYTFVYYLLRNIYELWSIEKKLEFSMRHIT